ncbi:MAG: TonB-dependent receptor [Bacteroidetes bacterium 24-39-8]|nr:MAG: TonB-dependent receptor [Sphingobacteriia bacterium 35-40-8]OYZ53080.1 MAG: TonB-dependent receptor [Bacteroidetes bacterium 24-39-8]OZA67224.1 MAG: TonB-dependent receptor [Sphingobacteriia bacterium 39-39-8]
MAMVVFYLPVNAQLQLQNLPVSNTVEQAKHSFSGVVLDKQTTKPLGGASIYLHEVKMGAVTDASGKFLISDIPSGKYLLEISFQGFSTHIETIDISGNLTKDFSLSETFAQHEEVVVTGVASATRTKLSPQPISIVKKADLLQSSASNIIDALSRLVSGVSALSTGPAISKPIIRGMGYNRVVTVHDGVRQEGQQWGDEHGIEVDEYSIQKVEVLKGPASLFYGSDAMAGVVHLITNAPVEKGTIKGNILGTYNANNGLLGTNANLAGHLKNGFNWNVYGTYKSAGDYSNAYDGKVFNSRFNERNFGGYLGVNKSWGYSHLLISNFNQKIGMVEGARDPATGGFMIFPETALERPASQAELDSRDLYTPYQGINHFKIASDNNIVVGKGRLNLNIGYQQNQRKEFGDPDNMNLPALYFNLQTITYNAQFHFAENKGWKTSIGISGMQQQNKNLAEEVLIPEYNQFDIGGFVYSKKTFANQITVSGGLRYDLRNVTGKEFMEGTDLKFQAFNKNFSDFSASIGLSYSPSEQLTWKLNIARGYRAPSVSELASNGAHEGTNRYEYGSLDLKTETSLQTDAGVEYNGTHISFGLTAFYNAIQNYVFYSKLSSVLGGDSLVNLGGSDLTAFKFRQANAALFGLEARLDLHPHPLDWLHFENSFSLVAGQFAQSLDGSNKLPFIPAPRLLSVLRANATKMGKGLRNAYVKLELDNTSTQNRVFTAYDTETPTAGYSLLNLGLGTEIVAKGKTLCSINLSFNNLTNISYQNHLNRLKYTDTNALTGRMGVFNMGRNLSLKLNIPLNFKVAS